MDSGNEIANFDVKTVSDYPDELSILPKFTNYSFLFFPRSLDLIHLHAPQRLFQMSHHADVCRHISGSFQAEEWEVDDVQARGMCFSPILKSHSTRGCGLNARVLSRIHAET